LRALLSAAAVTLTLGAVVVAPANTAGAASSTPSISSLSIHRDSTWGGRRVTITGQNFVGVQQVLFGTTSARIVSVPSSTSIVAQTPEASVSTVDVRVRTSAGLSPTTAADRFRFTLPTMDDPINGGWTAHQEQQVSSNFAANAARLGSVPLAGRSATWTPAMGITAAQRAKAWVGIPYSWAGGTNTGPSNGVCYSGDGGGGEFDCKVWGFDCSGLVKYGWGPYTNLAHFAASQYGSGRFHPAGALLSPGDLLFYGGSYIGHVVMYIGRGQVVQAWQSGHPVQISKLSDMRWMAGQYSGATRPMTTVAGHSATTVTGLSSHSGKLSGGELVTITGTGFGRATSVVIGSTVIYDFALLSARQILVKVPARAAGPQHIRVADAWGISPPVNADIYSWIDAPSVSGPAAPSGSSTGGDTVTFSGSNFRDVTSVTFGGVPATGVKALSPSQLRVVTPAHAAGTVSVKVTTRYGASRTVPFTYINPPRATGIDPPSGSASAGDVVTITGSSFGGQSFTGAVSVLFGQTPSASVSVLSPTTLTAVVPSGVVGTVTVTVQTRYGRSTPGLTFTYLP
jgi:cell wall-associated NlpC family hydrolase